MDSKNLTTVQEAHLEPAALWRQFAAICDVPHPSGSLEALRAYIIYIAQQYGCETQTDTAGNIMVRTGGQPRCCLQAHYDMVPQQDDAVTFDFSRDALQLRVADGQVMATGTTLGADNGIGVAAMLALIEMRQPQLELLFTADEETGMQGARQLRADWIKSDKLINLDTEQEGILMTGCAGAVNMTATLKCKMDNEIPEGDSAVMISLTGLQGGHSGMDIHLHRANACKLMNRFLKHLVVSFEARVASFNSGTLRNAIPREAQAIITVPGEIVDEVIDETRYYNDLYRDEYGDDEPSLSFTAQPVELPAALLPEEIQDDLLNAVEACHNGIWSMGKGYVDTSANMAHVQTRATGETEVLLMVRSMNEERKRACASAIQSAFLMAGFRVDFAANYEAWNIADDAPLVRQAVSAYQTMQQQGLAASACKTQRQALDAETLRTDKVHCGLECGVITEQYPNLQIISVGPTIHHPHSPQESVEIDSVARFWALITEMLKADL